MIEKVVLRNDRMEQNLTDISNANIPDTEKTHILSFFKNYALGKITRRRPDKSTMEHYAIYLRKAFEFLGKPSEELTEEDIDGYATALIDNTIKSKQKISKKLPEREPNPLSQSVKVKMMRTLSQYLKWIIPDKAPLLCKSLDVKDTQKKLYPQFLTEQEIDKLYRSCSSPERRYLIAVLFSSGARASEFCNIRRSDVKLPSGKENFVKITLQEAYSKTKGRTISLYYKNAIEAVSEFMEQRIKEGMKDDEPIWNTSKKGFSYNATHKWLEYTGEKVLGKSIHFHLFRSSCATWLATRLNIQELCYFFGWRFGSPMANIYIAREGIQMKEVDSKLTNTELGELQAKLQKTEYENKMTNEKIARMEAILEKLGNAHDKTLLPHDNGDYEVLPKGQ